MVAGRVLNSALVKAFINSLEQTVGWVLDFDQVAGWGLKESEKLLLKKEDRETFLCRDMKFSNIVIFSNWKMENVPEELGGLTKEISSQSVEGATGFF